MGVAGGGADRAVSQKFLQHGKVDTDFQEMSSKRVPEGMRGAMLSQTGGQTGVGECLAGDLVETGSAAVEPGKSHRGGRFNRQ